MEMDHVPHTDPEGRYKDQPYAGSLLHRLSVEVHCPVLLIDDCWWHLDLGPLYNKISQHLGLDGRPGGHMKCLDPSARVPTWQLFM